jgi:Cu+-exporting ATPase
MALESVAPQVRAEKVEYTCPMHPEIVRDAPGNCPICGMTLESRTVSLEEEKNPELVYMTRRFWVSVVLTVPLLLIAMSDFIPGNPLERIVSMRSLGWVQFALATPVVLWGGWPFFVRGWQSIVNRSLNMFTLIGLGVSVAYFFSVVAKLQRQPSQRSSSWARCSNCARVVRLARRSERYWVSHPRPLVALVKTAAKKTLLWIRCK